MMVTQHAAYVAAFGVVDALVNVESARPYNTGAFAGRQTRLVP